MTVAQIIVLALQVSIFLMVFSIGLEASSADLNYLFKHPRLFARSIFAMNIVMLAFAIAAGLAFDIHPAVKIAMIALAVSPVPPLLAKKTQTPGASADYMLGLVLAAAAAAIFIIPVTMELLGWIFGAGLHMPIGPIAFVVFISLFAPLGAGMLVRRFRPGLAAMSARLVSRVGTILLLIAFLPVLLDSARTIVALVGSGVIAFPFLFAVVGLAAGHLLGGPDPGNRVALAVATARRHPGIAVAIASINFPDQKEVPDVIVCCLIFGAVLSAVYTKWRLRADKTASAPLPKFS